MKTEIVAAVEAVLSGVESTAVPWDQTHFYAISAPWRALGYAVIPSDGPRSKVPLKGETWKQYCGEGRVPVPDQVWREWCSRYGDHEGLLIGDSSTGGLPDLVFVDADSPTVFSWCVSTFGATKLTDESGRAGGGRHHYYRVRHGVAVPQRNGQIGPRDSFVWISDPDDHRRRDDSARLVRLRFRRISSKKYIFDRNTSNSPPEPTPYQTAPAKFSRITLSRVTILTPSVIAVPTRIRSNGSRVQLSRMALATTSATRSRVRLTAQSASRPPRMVSGSTRIRPIS